MYYRFFSFFLLFVFGFLWIPQPLYAQSLADTLAKIDALFSEMDDHTPGASLTISRNDEIIYHKAFGMADLEHGMPNTTSTIFEAGSVSKQITATCILLLVMDGKLALDDDVHRYIPELSDYEKPFTVRQLINHTSGLKDWGSLAAIGGWPRGTRVYTNDLALSYIIRARTLNNVPGDEFIYSNANYTVMTHIVERVSGMSLPEFSHQRIFLPLGMNNTSWRDDFKRIVPGRATAYTKANDQYVTTMPFENTYGHAALLTTTADLDKWNTSWRETPLGTGELLKLRTERGVLNNGDTIPYAGGVNVAQYNGRPSVHHSGYTAGYRAWLAYYPDDALSVAYLSNDGDFSVNTIANGVAALFFGAETSASGTVIEEKPPRERYDPATNTLEGLEGTYYSAVADGEVSIRVSRDSVWLADVHGKPNVLSPVGPDTFERNAETRLVFKRDKEGKVLGFFMSVPQAKNVWFRRRGNHKELASSQNSAKDDLVNYSGF